MELVKTNKKTICLTTMVKNEEKVIGRMIDSCKEIIDYWVIMDTGSTDSTISIIRDKLKDIPGDLIEVPFVNFGHNRTQLVKKAKDKADYLLLLDADMTIGLSKKFDKTRLIADAYHIRYSGSLDFAQTLLVGGHVDWFYEGVTHEYITCGTVGNPPIYEELWVNHLLDGSNRPEKLERDKSLLEKDIIDNPGNSRSYFYLAQTYANRSMYDQAI